MKIKKTNSKENAQAKRKDLGLLLALGKSMQCLPLPSKKQIKKNKKAPKTKEKVGPEFPGEGAAITSAAGSISFNTTPYFS